MPQGKRHWRLPPELSWVTKLPSTSSVKLQLLGRRRLHTCFVFDASVTVVSPALVPFLTLLDASTEALQLAKIELGSVDKEVDEISMVDGSAVGVDKEVVEISMLDGSIAAWVCL